MFVSNDLVFLELQKTGGSHILRLLSQCLKGDIEGKHHRLDITHENKFIFGSIRNPWDWYVSLWAYGVGGQGAIRVRTHKGLDFNYYRQMLPRSMGKDRLTPVELFSAIFHDSLKPVNKWRAAYQNADDPKQFREWLKLVLNSDRHFDLGEGFAFSPLSSHAGLMTYRYLRLFTLGDQIYRDRSLASLNGLFDFDKKHNIAKAMIRTESLEDDFIAVLEKAGCVVTADMLDAIEKSGKTNRSKRNKAAFYYDQETIKLVSQQEHFLIEKYGYKPPVLDVTA